LSKHHVPVKRMVRCMYSNLRWFDAGMVFSSPLSFLSLSLKSVQSTKFQSWPPIYFFLSIVIILLLIGFYLFCILFYNFFLLVLSFFILFYLVLISNMILILLIVVFFFLICLIFNFIPQHFILFIFLSNLGPNYFNFSSSTIFFLFFFLQFCPSTSEFT
jgi:hypothetical protein